MCFLRNSSVTKKSTTHNNYIIYSTISNKVTKIATIKTDDKYVHIMKTVL